MMERKWRSGTSLNRAEKTETYFLAEGDIVEKKALDSNLRKT